MSILNKLCVIIVSVMIVTSLGYGTVFAEISLSSYDSTIGPTDRLLITGTIEGDIQSFHLVKLVVTDPSGDIIYQPDLPIESDGEFKYMLTPTLYGFDEGKYTVEASHEDLAKNAQLQFIVSSGTAIEMFDESMEKEVIPEFGTLSAMILAVAIISIILVSARSRFNVIPRL